MFRHLFPQPLYYPKRRLFLQVKPYLVTFLERFVLGADYVHIGFQLYNDASTSVFDLDTYDDTNLAKQAIYNATFTGKSVDALVGS